MEKQRRTAKRHVAAKRMGTFVLSLFLCAPLWAQLAGYQRTVIPTMSQMPVNAVNCIFQDSEGYMWYGTVDGLCRDDGYSVHTFRNDFLTPELIQINLVLSIAEDARHRIWFSTHKGLYVLDKRDYSIRLVDIPQLKRAHVGGVLAARDGFVYAWSGHHLYKVSLSGQLVEATLLPGPINDVYDDSHRHLVVSVSPKGLYVRYPGQRQFVAVSKDLRAMSVSESHNRDFLWVVAYDEKICKLRLDGTPRLEHQRLVGSSARDNRCFYQLVEDDHTPLLWLRTSLGLEVLRTGVAGTLVGQPTGDLLPQVNMLLTCLTKDRQGNLWVGGFDTPSFYVRYQPANTIGYVGPSLQSLTHYAPAIVTLCRDDGGRVWYYQEGNGLFFYHPATQRATSYRDCPSTAGAPFQVVPYLVRSRRRNSIWASTLTDAYLVQADGAAMQLRETVNLSAHTRKTGNVESIFEDQSGNLWISTMRGLYVWHAATRRVEVVSVAVGDISDFAQTPDGTLWATIRNRGIARVDTQGHLTVYPHDFDFTSIDATTDGHLWLGTGEGRVLEFAPATPSHLTDWTLRCGMNGDMVDHVAVDHLNHVWIITNQRVREFNPRNGAFRMFRTDDDNVPLDRFLPRAVYFDRPTATMYLGGIPGYVMLKPSQALEDAPKDIRVRISDVRVGGKSIWLTPGRRDGTDRIDISPDEANIAVSFSTLDYVNRQHVNYAYRLKGLDKEWTYLTDGRNEATYNTLAKGNYTLEVKATDEHGLWSNRVTRFTIHRRPAWYESPLAYALYALFILTLFSVLWRFYANWQKERQERQMVENLLKAKQMQIDEERRQTAVACAPASPSADKPHASLGVRLSNVRSLDEEFVEKAVRIVEQNLANPELNVMFLASELCMSRSTFMRKIKAVTGQTPLDFIKSVKLKHAYAMLNDKTATIQEVMKAVGYNDRKTFTQAFKEAFNITPNEHQHKA